MPHQLPWEDQQQLPEHTSACTAGCCIEWDAWQRTNLRNYLRRSQSLSFTKCIPRQVLQRMGYLGADQTVTMKGRVACEINSGALPLSVGQVAAPQRELINKLIA